MKFLLVEDDSKVADIMAMAFQMRWPESTIIKTSFGEDAISKVEAENPDLMVLDLGLPDLDGVEVIKSVRRFSNVPISILTARDEESDIVKGLEFGADDYMTKPFRQHELMSRAQAVMRRYHLIMQAAPLACGALRFGESNNILYFREKRIDLTITESMLLSHLMRNPEKIISTSILAEVIWGADYPGSGEAVRVYIGRIRKKLEPDPQNPKYIQTHPKAGYSLHVSDA
jgi:two-component system KDP operon response regulator KdpE